MNHQIFYIINNETDQTLSRVSCATKEDALAIFDDQKGRDLCVKTESEYHNWRSSYSYMF